MKEKRKKMICIVAAVLLLALCIVALWPGLVVRRYEEYSGKLHESVRLAVLADLHSGFYGERQEKLLAAIAEQSPDAVLLVGDIVDDKKSRDGAELLISALGDAYPCYYVSGNHEAWSEDAQGIKELLRGYGVTVLEGDTERLSVNGQVILIGGVDDPACFDQRYAYGDTDGSWAEQYAACVAAQEEHIYSVLLSHRPELTAQYSDSGFDLVLAGHAHGGQVRIPGILNGLLAPNQGLFPRYAGGRYQLGGTTLIVSRGLARNWIPRVFNRPELVIVDLLPQVK
ncbi:MAG: metallophosphoesterase [Bacillota bacterium]|nr:metallophosphoesterase [Bacillota bacterium]